MYIWILHMYKYIYIERERETVLIIYVYNDSISNLEPKCFAVFENISMVRSSSHHFIEVSRLAYREIAPPKITLTRWWFQIFFIFTPTWGDDPI